MKSALLSIRSPTWRRLHVARTVTLDRLHGVFQRIMGWTDSDLHEFIIAGRRCGKPDPERGPTVILPERAVKLRDVAPRRGRLLARTRRGRSTRALVRCRPGPGAETDIQGMELDATQYCVGPDTARAGLGLATT